MNLDIKDVNGMQSFRYPKTLILGTPKINNSKIVIKMELLGFTMQL